MARVTATRARQVIVVAGGELQEGYIPDNIAFYNPDGTPFDFSSLGGGGGGLQWGSAYDPGAHYTLNTVVKYNDGLWIQIFNGELAPGNAPDVDLALTADAPGGSEPPGTYTRITGGPVTLDPWPEDGHLLFFDLFETSDISISLSEDNGWAERLYNNLGTLLVTSDPGGPLEANALDPGRYFVWLPFPADTISVPVDVTFLSSGGILADNPWELMVQGV